MYGRQEDLLEGRTQPEAVCCTLKSQGSQSVVGSVQAEGGLRDEVRDAEARPEARGLEASPTAIGESTLTP